MENEVISKTRIRGVQNHIDQLRVKGKRQHLGGTDEGRLKQLIARLDYLTRKRSKQLRKIRDEEE